MQLTAQDLRALRNIIVRAADEAHEVLAAAANRPSPTARANPDFERLVEERLAQLRAEMPNKLCYGISETSKLLGLSRSTLYKMITDGEIKTLWIAGRRLVETAEIERLIQTGRDSGREPGRSPAVRRPDQAVSRWASMRFDAASMRSSK